MALYYHADMLSCNLFSIVFRYLPARRTLFLPEPPLARMHPRKGRAPGAQ